MMAFTAPQNVIVDARTLAPRGSRRARRDNSIAAVQDDTAAASREATHSANSCSNEATSGPLVTHPEESTRAAASRAFREISVRAKGIRVSGSSIRVSRLKALAP